MTSLTHERRPTDRPARRTSGSVLADRIVLAILVISIAAALGLAAATMLADLPAGLASLIPLDAVHHWSGFTA